MLQSYTKNKDCSDHMQEKVPNFHIEFVLYQYSVL